MKAFRYAVWLPVIHVVTMLPVITIQEATHWKFVPDVQAMENSEKVHSQEQKFAGSQIAWDPDFEYRPPTSVKAIYTAEFPAALLGLLCGHVPGHTFAPRRNETWCRRISRFVPVQTRILILDSVFIAAIVAQWWFIGRRLDRLRLEKRGMTWIRIPAIVITSAGLLVLLLSRGAGILELIAIIAAFLALLGWLILILAATISLGRMARNRLRHA